MGAGRTIGVLLGVVGLAVTAGIWLLLADTEPDAEAVGGGDTPAGSGSAAKTGDGEKSGGHRRTKVTGTASLFGQVKRRKGSEAATAQSVVITREGSDPWKLETDERGQFRAEALPDGGPYELKVEAAGFATIRLPGIALTRGEKRDVGTLWLDRAARAVVAVRSQSDEPILGADVAAYAAPNSDGDVDWSKAMAQMVAEPVAVTRAVTDALGKATFPELASGAWTFVATKKGLSREGRSSVQLEGGDVDESIRIVLRTGHEVKGRVLTEEGQPVPRALVIAMRPSSVWDTGNSALRVRATGDLEGRYRVDSLAAGDWALMAAAEGGAPALLATIRVPSVTEIDLHLSTGGKLFGKVTTAGGGKPVEGAVVRASSWSGGAQVVECTTDAEGNYSFDPLPASAVNELTVEKAGLVLQREGPRWQETHVPAGDQLERNLVMSVGGTISGVVRGPVGTDGADAPVSGAKVRLWVGSPTEGAEDRGSTVTAADGTFSFDGIAKGHAVVQARADGLFHKDFPEGGYWAAMQQPGDPSFGADVGPGVEAKLELHLVRGTRVSGTVVTDDGPVAGAMVSTDDGPTVRSAEDGSFTLDGIAPSDAVTLHARKDGLVARTEEPIAITEGQNFEGAVVHLVKQPTVRGTLYAAPGATLVDPRVAVIVKREGEGLAYYPFGESDESDWQPVRRDGTFEVSIPAAEGKFFIRGAAEGNATADSADIELVAGRIDYTQDLTLALGDRVFGRALAGGSPVAGVQVGVVVSRPETFGHFDYIDNSNGSFPVVVAVSDANGAFAVEHLGAGTYTVSGRAEGFVTASKGGAAPGGAEVVLAMEPELELNGKVTFSDGTPAGGLWITRVAEPVASGLDEDMLFPSAGDNGGAAVGSDGRFRLRGLAAGQYKVHVEAPWGSTVNAVATTAGPFSAGARDVSVVVERGGIISGRILDSQKHGVGGCWVNANQEQVESANEDAEEDEFDGGWHGTQSKDDGSFELVGLAPGIYSIHVQPNETPGGTQGRPTTREKVPANTRNLDLVLDEGLAIEGKLVDGAGKPVAQFAIQANPIAEEGVDNGEQVWGRSAITAADGTFRIGGLAPGKYQLASGGWDPSGKAASKLVTGGDRVAAGTAGIHLVAIEGLRITGVVVDERGVGVPRAQLNANAQSGSGWHNASTDKTGRFELVGLSAGTYSVSVQAEGWVQSAAVVVPAGTQDRRIELTKGLRVSGRLLDGAGHPLSRVQLQFNPPAEDQSSSSHGWAVTNAEGRFTSNDLAAGTYTVSASIPSATQKDTWETKELGTVRAGDGNVELSVR